MQTGRYIHTLSLENTATFKEQLLGYYCNATHVVLLDSNGHDSAYSSGDWIAATGLVEEYSSTASDALSGLNRFYNQVQDWCFGYLSYDVKNELESLKSDNPDVINAPLIHFFVPQLIFICKQNTVTIYAHNNDKAAVDKTIQSIQQYNVNRSEAVHKPTQLQALDTRISYIKKVNTFLEHIHRGDVYEANFCTSFTASDVSLDAVTIYKNLNAISKPPFAGYASMGDIQIMCASPERYIKKTGATLISQPIKGTARRDFAILEDERLKKALYDDPKERSENVMIVDLVRNDLSRIALKGSVHVTELFGLYSFKQVHQMISTITAQVPATTTPVDVLAATFPMGSMTGAPKISAMQIIEANESFKRGIYSGSLGYFTPDGSMDFNVIIRTILYNKASRNCSISVGSAITAAAQSHKEYDECMLKAQALLDVLSAQGITLDKESC